MTADTINTTGAAERPLSLSQVGRALYGHEWQTDLARALGLSARTVRYWAQTGRVPASRWNEIAALVRLRQFTLGEIARKIHLSEMPS